ncbi:hypothetical protein M0813_22853 [Anaeramoeba flamelloides]|uniref:Uncharacterized protein n=1 Tax=Anaeramoeba flamelloides TaxID=1746091 RepID=A0ABQ8YBZ0_9EUKA|nr:hypothetical protein M0813_22853 [Anaeramoeba flamelloides]
MSKSQLYSQSVVHSEKKALEAISRVLFVHRRSANGIYILPKNIKKNKNMQTKLFRSKSNLDIKKKEWVDLLPSLAKTRSKSTYKIRTFKY